MAEVKPVKLPYDKTNKRFYKEAKGRTWRGKRNTPNTPAGYKIALAEFLEWLRETAEQLPKHVQGGNLKRKAMVQWLQENEPANPAIEKLKTEAKEIEERAKLGEAVAPIEADPFRTMSEAGRAVWLDRLKITDVPRQATFVDAWESFIKFKSTRTTPDALAVLRSHWNAMIKDYLANVALGKLESSHFESIYTAVKKLNRSDKHKSNVMATCRQFLQWCNVTERVERLPKSILSPSFKIKVGKKKQRTFDRAQVRQLIEAADDRMKLNILLGLNCAFTQGDLHELRVNEIDLKAGTITRKRSKLDDHDSENIPTVIRHLWPETLALLKTEMKKKDYALGNGPTPHNLDRIGPDFRKLCDSLSIDGSFKTLRKTGPTILGSSTSYKGHREMYLGNAEPGVTGRSYDQAEKLPKEITDYVRQQLL